MENKKEIGIAVLGCSSRMKFILTNLSNILDFEIIGAYDKNIKAVNNYREPFGKVDYCKDINLLSKNEKTEWVFIGSINAEHKEQILAALNAQKNIFCEKPIATNLRDLKEIKKTSDKNKKNKGLFLVSYPLRYSPHYRKIKQIIDSGKIGEIISLEFNEVLKLSHGAFIMTDWRRLEKYSGGHILEKCCHDIDIVNWLVESLPKKVSSFGGQNFFKKENSQLFEENKKFMKENQKNPFLSDKDIIDNQVAILEYNNGVRATFHTNCASGIPERRIYICGTKGTIRADLQTGKIEIRSFNLNEKITEIINEEAKGGHGGGDKYLIEDLKKAIISNKYPDASLNDAIVSATSCLAFEESRKQNKVVDLTSTWKELGI